MTGLELAVFLALAWGVTVGLFTLLEKTGCRLSHNTTVTFGYAKWQTTLFNLPIERFSVRFASNLRNWFTVGAVLGVGILCTSSLGLLLHLVFWRIPGILNQIVPAASPSVNESAHYASLAVGAPVAKAETVELVPIIPGVNLPLDHFVFYLIALFLSAVVHEFGHAAAAASESVKINGIGFMFFLIYPGAFVEMNERNLHELPPSRQLRIYCAGAWHNIVLAATTFVIMTALPTLLIPLFSTGSGAVVVSVHPSSPLMAVVRSGDMVVDINGKTITSKESWVAALVDIATHLPMPYCVVHEWPTSDTSCCEPAAIDHHLLQCFEDIFTRSKACLPPKEVMKNYAPCSVPSCTNGHCAAPVLSSPSSRNRLVHLRVTGEGRRDVESVFFSGDAASLYHGVVVSDYKSRWGLLLDNLPDMLELTLSYTTAFSSAMAVLNLTPVYYLDGQWGLAAILDIVLPSATPMRRRSVLKWILGAGSLLFLLNIMEALLRALL